MLVEILTFLATHKVIITGAATTLAEVVVVFVNMRRKLKKQSKDTQLMSKQNSVMKNLIWSANPINLFREP